LYSYFVIQILFLIIILKTNYFINSLLLTLIQKPLLSSTVVLKTSLMYIFYFSKFTFNNYFKRSLYIFFWTESNRIELNLNRTRLNRINWIGTNWTTLNQNKSNQTEPNYIEP